MADTDPREIERWLTERFGGVWLCWRPETSLVPGTTVAAQLKENEAGRYVLTGLLLLGEVVTADSLRKVPVAAIENTTNLSTGVYGKMRAELAKLPPLTRTPDMAPEDFSRLVAQHYNVWARYVPHPAAAMAAEAGAKVPTVHTWVREARLRGFLPPARRGKGRK